MSKLHGVYREVYYINRIHYYFNFICFTALFPQSYLSSWSYYLFSIYVFYLHICSCACMFMHLLFPFVCSCNGKISHSFVIFFSFPSSLNVIFKHKIKSMPHKFAIALHISLIFLTSQLDILQRFKMQPYHPSFKGVTMIS